MDSHSGGGGSPPFPPYSPLPPECDPHFMVALNRIRESVEKCKRSVREERLLVGKFDLFITKCR